MIDQGSLGILKNKAEEDNKSSKESIIEQTLKDFFSTKDIEMKSDLRPELVVHMARGKVFCSLTGSKVMKSLIDNMLILSVSKDRKGRAEYVQLVRNSQDPMLEGNDRGFNWKSILGKGRD